MQQTPTPDETFIQSEVLERRGHRGIPRWAMLGSGLLLFSLLLGMLVIMPLYGRPNYEVGLYDAWKPGASVTVRGKTWPTGAVARIADVRMVAVGRTDEGHLVYVDSHKNYGGGGGGRPETTSDLSAYRELYVRTGEAAYVAIDRP